MKTTFKYVALMAVGLLAGLTSCSNDNENAELPEAGAPKNMLIKITNEAPTTRTEEPAQGATPVGFSSGHLYFTNGTVILKQYKIVTTSTPGATDEVLVGDLTAPSGATITNLPPNVSKVHIVGNTAVSSTSTLIADIKAEAIDVVAQKAIGTVNLYGEAAATSTGTTSASGNEEYTAAITLKPTVARIELADVKGEGVIESFDVEGVFVDNYYASAQVGGVIPTTVSLTDNGASITTNAAAVLAFVAGSSQYPDGSGTPATPDFSGALYDWYSIPLSSSSKLVAPSGGIWGYNVFAAEAGSALPRLVVRLDNFTTTTGSGVTFGDPQFITIRGFKNASDGSAITTIEPGKVYTIAAGALKFNETNVSPLPGVNEIDVEVKVTLANWTIVPVTPEL